MALNLGRRQPLTSEKPVTIAPAVVRLTPFDMFVIVLVAAFWGVAFVGIKETALQGPPLQVAGIRFCVAALPLMFFVLRPSRLKKLKPLDFAKFALLGVFQTALMFGIIYSTVRVTPAGVSSIIVNTNPFFVAVFAHLVIAGDRLTGRKIVGLGLGFSGVLTLVLLGKGVGDVALIWPILLLIAAVTWAFSSILVKLLGFTDILSMTCWQMFFGSLPLLFLGFVFESDTSIQWSGGFIFWLAYTAFVASTFCWWAWYVMLQKYSASRISVWLFLVPVFGVISSILILGESLSYNLIIGGLLVVTGIAIVNSRGR